MRKVQQGCFSKKLKCFSRGATNTGLNVPIPDCPDKYWDHQPCEISPSRTQEENQRFETGTTPVLRAQGKPSSNVITKSAQSVFPNDKRPQRDYMWVSVTYDSLFEPNLRFGSDSHCLSDTQPRLLEAISAGKANSEIFITVPLFLLYLFCLFSCQ